MSRTDRDPPGVAAAGVSAPPPPTMKEYAWWRENIEALVVAVILALIIRHFAVEAFEIPTGSMADTLYGLHAWLDCPNCPKEYNVALQSDGATGKVNVDYSRRWAYFGDCHNPNCTLAVHGYGRNGAALTGKGEEIACQACGSTFRGDAAGYRQDMAKEAEARCPNCHIAYTTLILQKNVTGGHKILVNKFAYTREAPGRWDVIVFGFDQWKNYIKRLVGLPGELIQVWDGDVYVDGKVVRKSDHRFAQEALWTQISDSSLPERGLQKTPAWGPPRAGGLVAAKATQWDGALLRWSLNASEGPAVIEYQRGFDNYYNYNIILHSRARVVPALPPRDRPAEQVGDKKVAFAAKIGAAAGGAGDGAWIGAEVRDGDFTFQLRVPVGAPSESRPAVLEQVGAPVATAPQRAAAVAAVAAGTEARLELENADDRVIARLDGTEILRLDYTSLPPGADLGKPPPPPSKKHDDHHLRIIASGVLAEVSAITVHRDMFYIPHNDRGEWRGIQLGPGEYFAMGDNAPSSSDGRYWGAVPEKNLMGRALLVFWPAWPTNFQWKFIR